VSEPYTPLDAAYAAARWGWYLAAFLILGAGSYAPFLVRIRTGLDATHPELADDLAGRAARIGATAGFALLALTGLRLYLQTRTLLGPDEATTSEFLRATLTTAWGHGWIRQALMALLATAAFVPASRGSRLGWMVAAAASGGLGLTAGMTGHATTAKAGSWGFLLDAAHVWAGGLWLGGLAVLLLAGLPACRGLPAEERPTLHRALVGDFSRRALLFGPLAMGLGVWLAVRYLGWSWPLHLAGSGYEIALAVKLAALAGVAAMGAWNWRVVQPRLARPDGEARLRHSARLELLFGSLLLAATAVLVALPFPGEEM
jgi:putative copper export protein